MAIKSLQKQQISTKNAPLPAGPYSQALIVGDLIFVAGQRPENPETGETKDGIEEQTEQCIKNIEQILIASGSSLENIVRSNIYLSDVKYFDQMNLVYEQMIPQPYPVRTTVGAQLRNILVEIEVIAYLNDGGKEHE